MMYSYLANLLFIIFTLQSVVIDATHEGTSVDITGYTSVYSSNDVSTANGISIGNTDQSSFVSSMAPSTQSTPASTPGGTSVGNTNQSTTASSISPSTQSTAASTAGGTSIGNIGQSSLTSSVGSSTAASTVSGILIGNTSQSSLVSSMASSTQSSTMVRLTTDLFSSAVQTTSSFSPPSSVTSATLSTATSNFPSSTLRPTSNTTRRYQYSINSNVSLKVGVINDSAILLNITGFVRASFNLTNGTTVIGIARAEINNNARAISSALLTDVIFNAAANCSDDCLNRAITPITPSTILVLPSANGSPVQITGASAPSLSPGSSSSSTTAPQSFEKGESPPGRAAQLGMGLGISFFAVIIIAEIVFLYKKYGCNDSTRSSDYELRYYQDEEGA